MSDPADTPPASLQKKKKKKKKRRSEGLDESPPVVDSPDETKKKKRKREGDEDVEEISLPPAEEEMKKRKEVQKEKERVAMVTTDKNVAMEEEKKKKKRKEEDRTVVDEPPVVSSPVKTKKKMKRKEVQKERVAMVTTDNSSVDMQEKKKKKKKRKEEGRTVVDEPSVVSSPLETKKKKKKHKEVQKEEESIAMVTTDNSSVDMQEKKKKKKRKEEDRTVVDEPSVVSSPLETKKKKKKHKEVQKEEESITMVTTDNSSVDMQEKKKKKKKKRKEEGSITMVTTDNSSVSMKKKKQEEEDCIIIETCQSEEKKKKKQRNGLMEPSITMVTTAKHMESEPLVPMDTSKSRKKEKRKKQEDCIIVGTTETEVRNITMVTATKNSPTEHLEKKYQVEQVAIETTEKEQQLQKNRNQIDRQMEPSIAMETGDAWSEAQLQELKEYVPNLSRKSSNVIRKLLLYDLSRFREFKKQGVALRWGRFSEEENQQIRANVYDFLVLTGIDSVEELMFPQRFKDKEAEIKKLRINHHYIQSIAEGIPRPCLQVLVRAKKMMDNRNHMGRFTEDEVHTLTKLHTLHGNDWKVIAEKMNRSTSAVLKRFATTGGDKGTWSPDEVSRLKGAVEDHLKIQLQKSPPGSGLTRQQLCVKLPWTKISLAVKSRTWYQCRLKWFSILKHRLEDRRSTSWLGIQNRITIINTLFNMNVREPRDVDWMKVAKAVGAVTPVYVQKTFCRMKTTRVPNWDRLTYGEIVDILRERELPRMQMRLDRLKTKDQEGLGYRQTEDAPDTQNSYQLSEIFPESGALSGDELSGVELSGDELSHDV